MLTKCNNGHWYDTSVYRACPHCKLESEKLSIRLNDVEEDDRTISIAEADISLGEELGAIIGNKANSFIPTPDSLNGGADDDKTISFGFFGMMATQPVVGWLVCMTGSEKGKDYRLHAGKNFIGRSPNMDVVLVDDKTISRDRHCSVIYDPKGNAFYVTAEKGNLMYLNDQMIDVSDKLKEGDIITIGETKLMFIPFCKEGRIWEKE
ncbi:MAG: FHA domain-containing protein [Lachnospiraceae bacterium]